MHSAHETNPDICAEVYRSWKSARDALSHSIRIYLNACDALASVSIETLTCSKSVWGSSLSIAPSMVDNDLSGLADDEERLRNARLKLLVSRNNSRSFSRINSLPQEILSLIFIASNSYLEGRDSGYPASHPTVISSVCQLWRHIALSIPSLWSHLSIDVDGAFLVNSQKCAELWSKRSKNSPLHVDLLQLDCNADPQDGLWDLQDYFPPLVPRIQSLYLESSQYFMHFVLHHMIEGGRSGSAKALQFRSKDDTIVPLLSWPEEIESPPHSDHVASFLTSIQYLELSNTFFPWNSSAYHGLVELSLDLSRGGVHNTDYLPTQREIAQMLASSPMLREISIILNASCRHRGSSIEPIILNNLESFKLISRGAAGCLGFFPLIAPGKGALEVNIYTYSGSTFTNELRSFISRSNITTLRITPMKSDSWFLPFSSNLSGLESLTLHGCDFDDENLRNFLHASSTSDSRISLWPKLHRLELESC
ncbi:hypothetical protein BDV93DRAFT_297687 [Ceratobasidium sp. AG-I]|nr:hypothetical protein BDV93DRAFT_297687 [Ceratobasidium sp. AG-I]